MLFGGASYTDRYFAWTIKPPATAAFLGAAYAAGCVLVVLALRRGTWLALRLPFVTILIFTVITLLATLLHLDRFHFGSDLPVAQFAAWFWMAVYVVVPLLMIVVLSGSSDPRRRSIIGSTRSRGWSACCSPSRA